MKNFKIILVVFLFLIINNISYSQSAIKIGKLEVMDIDLGKMSWDEANNKVKEKGNGWRLPNKEELFYLYKNKNLITGLSDKVFSYYWTSEKFAENKIWALEISNGFETTDKKEVLNYVRLIKEKIDLTIKNTKNIIIESKIKKDELDLSNLWDEYSGTLEAYSLGNFFGKEAIAPESFNNFKIFKNGNKIIWSQLVQGYSTDVYDGIYKLTFEPSGNIVKLKCKFNLRNAGKHPSTPGLTLIIDLSKSSGYCVQDNLGKRVGQTYNIFTQKTIPKIKEEQNKRLKGNKITGTPKKIDNLEVAEKDFPNRMNWDDAKKACSDLGDGWRLPTKDELNILFQNKWAIGGFVNNEYWSSTEGDFDSAWLQYFGNRPVETLYTYIEGGGQRGFSKNGSGYVRAVRSF